MDNVYLPLANVPLPRMPGIPIIPGTNILGAFAESSTAKCLGIPKLPPLSSIQISNFIAALAGLVSISIPRIPNPSLTAEIMVTIHCVPPIGFGANFSLLNSISNPQLLLTQLKSAVPHV